MDLDSSLQAYSRSRRHLAGFVSAFRKNNAQDKMGKRFHVTHIVHNLICKVNKHIALRLQLDSMALRMLLSATVLEGAFISAYFANGSDHERKGLLSTTGLHLVLKTSCLRKKMTFSLLSYGRMFSRNNDRRETLVLP